MLPIAHHELVERERWINAHQFVELLTISQVLPGPNIVNFAIIFGDRFFGWRGAAAASAGLLVLPMVIVLALAMGYQQLADWPSVTGALRGMGAVAAGLIIATAAKLARSLKRNPLGIPTSFGLGAATLVMVGFLRWPMVWWCSAWARWAWRWRPGDFESSPCTAQAKNPEHERLHGRDAQRDDERWHRV